MAIESFYAEEANNNVKSLTDCDPSITLVPRSTSDVKTIKQPVKSPSNEFIKTAFKNLKRILPHYKNNEWHRVGNKGVSFWNGDLSLKCAREIKKHFADHPGHFAKDKL